MATRTALSASLTDVNNAVNGLGPFVNAGPALDGDTVIIPAGTQTWNGRLSITKAITLRGAGVGSTIIKDGGGVVQGNPPAPHGDFIHITMSPGDTSQVMRLKGIEFQDGGRLNGEIAMNVNGNDNRTDARFVWEDCHWGDVKNGFTLDTLIGVVGNVTFTNGQRVSYGPFCKRWNGGVGGEKSWNDAINWGTEHWLFFEDCTFDVPFSAADVFYGGRVVVRNCHFPNVGVFSTHGTETGPGPAGRGVALLDYYGNDFNTSSAACILRSGVLVAHDNVNAKTSVGWKLSCYRTYMTLLNWGGADGRCKLDLNDFTQGGTNTNPTPYATGVSSGSDANLVMTAQGDPGWAVNRWAGYTLINTSLTPLDPLTGVGDTHYFAFIISNTHNTIKYNFGIYANMAFANGDTFAITKVLQALDQSGVHGGSLTGTGTDPKFPNTDGTHYPGGKNDMHADPCYEWNNVRCGAMTGVVPVVRLNEHYKQNTVKPSATIGLVEGYPVAPYTYPHPLLTGSSPTTGIIDSVDHANFEQSVSGSFQVTTSGFSPAANNFTITSGAWPTGVTMDISTGLISGTPSVNGTFAVTLRASNGTQSDTQPFTLTVAPATKIISITGTLAFGDVDVNTTAQRSFTILNNGNTVLTVTNITLPSGFTADWSSGTIAAGASHVVVVTFAPVAATSYSGTVTVVSDKTSGTNTLAASGVGAARVISLSGNLAFGDITVGQTATKQLTISNTGNRALTVNSITFPTDFSGGFVGTIAAGGSQVVNVTFSPTVEQAYSDVITVLSNKTSGTNTRAVTGNGVVTATAIIQLTGSLVFGSILTGSTLTKTLRITNGGDTTLNVSGITYPSGFTGAYSGAIASGAFHDVVVTFSPVANTTYSGTVTVASDATGGTNTTTASGTGVAPTTKIIALSGNLGFGNVVIGSTSTHTLTIANSGSAILTVTSITLPTGFTGSFSGTIDPGTSQDVVISFSPLLNQSYDGTITVVSDKTSGTDTIAVTGSGAQPTTRVILLTGNLAFGNVQKNHTVIRPLTVANTGTDNLVVTSVTAPTGFSVDWTSGTIAPGTTQNVNVSFSPTAQQPYGGDITVASNKTAGTNTIACSGNGKNKKQVPFFLIVG